MVHDPKTGLAGYVILEGPQYVGVHSEDLQILRFINPHHYHCDHHHHRHRHLHRHRHRHRHSKISENNQIDHNFNDHSNYLAAPICVT